MSLEHQPHYLANHALAFLEKTFRRLNGTMGHMVMSVSSRLFQDDVGVPTMRGDMKYGDGFLEIGTENWRLTHIEEGVRMFAQEPAIMVTSEIPVDVGGCCANGTHYIVNDTLTIRQRLYVVLREIANTKLHPTGETYNTGYRDFEANAVAFVVMHACRVAGSESLMIRKVLCKEPSVRLAASHRRIRELSVKLLWWIQGECDIFDPAIYSPPPDTKRR
jgi:hypothetical protein